MLRRFVAMFPAQSVNDLAKAHLDKFFAELPKTAGKSRNGKPVTSPATRNHYRESLRQFFGWAVGNDLLPSGHRLLEADSMRPQKGNASTIQCYTPAEFKALLEAAEGLMRAMIAIGGLAGLRTAELLRLDWEDTRRCEGHIEVTSGKAKTRARRLVEVVRVLKGWIVDGEFYCAECVHRLVENGVLLPPAATLGNSRRGSIAVPLGEAWPWPCEGCGAEPKA